MKRIFATMIATASILGASASSEARWIETTHDFGAFDENDGKVTCEFKFVNTGDEPLTVVAARATCGCTVPRFPRESIAPGDTASVAVTYDPTGRPGRFEKKVYVDLSTPGESRTTLNITGVVIGSANTLRSRYPVDAGQLKMRSTVMPFGDVVKGRSKAAFFEVYNATGDTLAPTWEKLPAYLKVGSATPSIPPGEQTSYAITLTADATDLYGIVTDSIYLRPTPDTDPIKIDFVAMLNEDFSRLTPGQLASAPQITTDVQSVDFGTFDPQGGKITRTFNIGNRGKDRLILRRVYTTDPGVSVKVNNNKIKRGGSAQVTITVDPSQLPSELLNARISIISNDPENPTLGIRAVGLPE